MNISRSWLETFLDLPESVEELRGVMDDLGLVVEGMRVVGEGLESVVVARVDEVHAIEGADRIRRVIVEAGTGPLTIVCGAMNFDVGNRVPLAPVGAVLPGDFVISERKMKGVVSNGMLCSARELQLSDDHVGLMILDDLTDAAPGTPLVEALAISPDVIFEISVEGNRPDAWSIEGVARDIAARLGRTIRTVPIATPNDKQLTNDVASAAISTPSLCGRLTVSVLENVEVGPSPHWVVERLTSAGMRSINNVVDASNFVMLELGQPTHAYDARNVAKHHLGVRSARPGEVLVTLDGVERPLAQPGRGLGDTGDDCVIVDGDDHVLSLAGIMGGASSEISDDTTTVLFESAFFEPMTVARSTKRHGLRTEGSNRFERGVDPTLALRAVGRFVHILQESSPQLRWLKDPLDVMGDLPSRPEITIAPGDVEKLLGTAIPSEQVVGLLRAINFDVREKQHHLYVTPSTARLDIRDGVLGRADVIEEIARLYGYGRLERHTPTWPEPGSLNARQRFRRLLRSAVVGLGWNEAWTPTLGNDADFELLSPAKTRVRITNPLAADESVLRSSMIVGLLHAWSKNLERGEGDVALFEVGVVFEHPADALRQRLVRGGAGGHEQLSLPPENERLTALLGRASDDASTAVASWEVLARRLGLLDVVVRSLNESPDGFHPTRSAVLEDRGSGAVLGYLGEVDPALVQHVAGDSARRVALIDLDLDVLSNSAQALRQSHQVVVPSRYPSALMDLAFVVPNAINAQDLRFVLATSDPHVEDVQLFDTYRDDNLGADVRSLAYAVRLSANDRTLSDDDVARLRERLLASAQQLGAVLR